MLRSQRGNLSADRSARRATKQRTRSRRARLPNWKSRPLRTPLRMSIPSLRPTSPKRQRRRKRSRPPRRSCRQSWSIGKTCGRAGRLSMMKKRRTTRPTRRRHPTWASKKRYRLALYGSQFVWGLMTCQSGRLDSTATTTSFVHVLRRLGVLPSEQYPSNPVMSSSHTAVRTAADPLHPYQPLPPLATKSSPCHAEALCLPGDTTTRIHLPSVISLCSPTIDSLCSPTIDSLLCHCSSIGCRPRLCLGVLHAYSADPDCGGDRPCHTHLRPGYYGQ